MKSVVIYSPEFYWKSRNHINKSILSALSLEKKAFETCNAELINDEIFDLSNSFVFLALTDDVEFILPKLPQGSSVTIFIFGEFIHELDRWNSILSLLNNHMPKFIFASTAQEKLFHEIVNVKPIQTKTIPPPATNSKLFYSNENRNKFRSKFKLEVNDFCFVYSGRLSYTKNIDKVIMVFSELKKIFPNQIKLFLAGEMDDLGNTLKKEKFQKNWFKENTKKHISNDESIIYLGNLEDGARAELLSGSDLFISLSTYHDEDFGVAPLEASECGLSLLLTSWGGYNDFKANLNATMIKPEFVKGRFNISKKICFIKLMELIDDGKKTDKNRYKVSDATKENYGNDKFLEDFFKFLKVEVKRGEDLEFRSYVSPTFPFLSNEFQKNLYSKAYLGH